VDGPAGERGDDADALDLEEIQGERDVGNMAPVFGGPDVCAVWSARGGDFGVCAIDGSARHDRCRRSGCRLGPAATQQTNFDYRDGYIIGRVGELPASDWDSGQYLTCTYA